MSKGWHTLTAQVRVKDGIIINEDTEMKVAIALQAALTKEGDQLELFGFRIFSNERQHVQRDN